MIPSLSTNPKTQKAIIKKHIILPRLLRALELRNLGIIKKRKTAIKLARHIHKRTKEKIYKTLTPFFMKLRSDKLQIINPKDIIFAVIATNDIQPGSLCLKQQNNACAPIFN